MIERYTRPEMARALVRGGAARALARGRAARWSRRWPSAARCRPTPRATLRARRARRRRAHAGDRGRGQARRHRVRVVGRRDGRRRGPLPPPRPDVVGRRRHRVRAAAARRRRPAARGPRSRCARRVAGAGASAHQRHADDRPHPRHPRRADHLRAQVRRAGTPSSAAIGARLAAARDEIALRQALGRGRHLRQHRARGRGGRAARGSASRPSRSRRRSCRATATPRSSRRWRVVGRDARAHRASRSATCSAPRCGEAQEPFGAGQKGSSAMPHKRNPILAENLCGLARLVRGYALAALENMALWHERDISHSSVERVIAPDATIALDFMLARLAGVVEGLEVRPEAMRANLERSAARSSPSRCCWRWSRRGVARDEAYRWVQRHALAGGDFAGAARAPIRTITPPSRRATSIASSSTSSTHLRHIDDLVRRGLWRTSDGAAVSFSTRAKPRSSIATDDPDLLIQYFKDDATAFNAQEARHDRDEGHPQQPHVRGPLPAARGRRASPTHFVRAPVRSRHAGASAARSSRSRSWCATSSPAAWRSGSAARGRAAAASRSSSTTTRTTRSTIR